MLKILYLGDDNLSSTSYHRSQALVRLGHNVDIISPKRLAHKELNSFIMGPIHFRTGYKLIQTKMLKSLRSLNKKGHYDLIWVNAGELLDKSCIEYLRTYDIPIVLYHNDDPIGGRDGRRFDSLIGALPYYDLCAVVREQNVSEFKDRGAKQVLRVYMSYDEVQHSPFVDSESIGVEFRSDVAFIGTWMKNEKRDLFLLKLSQEGVPISIWGNRWHKSKYWRELRPFIRGGALVGKDYVAAVQGAKICIGMLSKGNRDLHTTRSMEIPFAGGLLCAERTSEHTLLYSEHKEAVFWSNELECAEICKSLLIDEIKRESIRSAGARRVRSNKTGNEDICKQIIDEVFKIVKGVS